MVKIDFEFSTPYGIFRDALFLPVEHGLSDAEIEDLKRTRLTNWVDAIENPPTPVIEE